VAKRERHPSGLRRRAEERLARASAGERPVEPSAPGDAETLRLLHELQVHQVELEMQNEELRSVHALSEDARRRYAELFDFAPIGYFHLSLEGAIVSVNFAGAGLLGLHRAQVVGRPMISFVSEADRAAFRRFLGDVLSRIGHDAPAEVAEVVLLRLPEGAVHVRVTGALLDGPPASCLLALEDVTARRRAEDALRAEARRKDEFLATLSHELRNPLAPIRNGIYLLQHGPDGDKARTALAVIDRQVTHLTRIIDDLLDVTRIARGKVRLQRELLDLGELAQRTVEDHRAAFDEAGVHLELDRAPSPCWVEVDGSRLAQVLGNLLGNALKFTNRGGHVRVSVDLMTDRAALRVRDTGVGIAPEVLERLFEPFQQAPQTLERTRGGLGLGLAMVKGLVELHGGTVQVRSAGLGHGAEFAIHLPLADAPAHAPAPHQASLGSSHRVLVIDDNEDAATSLRDVLELSGHRVRVALDGPAGLAAAREFDPEVVICDIGLPRMDGYEVARKLRSDARLRRAWLVAMTGYAAPEDLERARAAGFDRHVAKPPTLEKLESLFAEAPPPRPVGAPS
jgi:PAS domain S-box-containing protein